MNIEQILDMVFQRMIDDGVSEADINAYTNSLLKLSYARYIDSKLKNLTEEEIDRGAELMGSGNIEEALDIMRNAQPQDLGDTSTEFFDIVQEILIENFGPSILEKMLPFS